MIIGLPMVTMSGTTPCRAKPHIASPVRANSPSLHSNSPDKDGTGGNSGSPTLNARGELVGLAFDGNYEAMASDWLFLPDLTRSA